MAEPRRARFWQPVRGGSSAYARGSAKGHVEQQPHRREQREVDAAEALGVRVGQVEPEYRQRREHGRRVEGHVAKRRVARLRPMGAPRATPLGCRPASSLAEPPTSAGAARRASVAVPLLAPFAASVYMRWRMPELASTW